MFSEDLSLRNTDTIVYVFLVASIRYRCHGHLSRLDIRFLIMEEEEEEPKVLDKLKRRLCYYEKMGRCRKYIFGQLS